MISHDSGKEKITVKAVFLIAFCDKDLDRLEDTLNSISYYVKEPHCVICVNDCLDEKNIAAYSDAASTKEVLYFIPNSEVTWPRNTYGSLFCKKYQALEFILQKFTFDYLVHLDTDALVTGHDLLTLASFRFEGHSREAGTLGSYKVRADGKRRTRWEWAIYMLYLVYGVQKMSRRSILWSRIVPSALQHGYQLGAHVLGGAFLVTYDCIKAMTTMYPSSLLIGDRMQHVPIGDDVLFSLMTYASGYRIDDFGSPSDPLAIAQNYLPLSKEKIADERKQLIHSIKRGKDGESEAELREYFRRQRV